MIFFQVHKNILQREFKNNKIATKVY